MKWLVKKVLLIVLILFTLSVGCMAMAETVSTLVLPSELKVIDDEAFYGNTSIGNVVIPEGTTTIRSKAFAASSIVKVELPSTLTSIADDAFNGCGAFSAVVWNQSYAHYWCMANSIKYTVLVNPVPASGVELSPKVLYMTIGDMDFISADVLPQTATNKALRWSSSDPNVVTIGEYGFLSAVKAGQCTITATTEDGGYTDTSTVYVVNELTATVVADKTTALTGESILWTVYVDNGGGAIQYKYYLYNGDGIIDSDVSSTDATFSYIPEEAGEYILRVILQDEAGTICNISCDSVSVNPDSIGYVSLLTDGDGANIGDTISFTASTSYESENLRYQFVIMSDGEIAAQSDFQDSVMYTFVPKKSSDAYSAYVTVMDMYNECVSSDTIEFIVRGTPAQIEIASISEKITLGDPIAVKMSSIGAYCDILYTYKLWHDEDPIITITDTTSETFSYTPQNLGTYKFDVYAFDRANSKGTVINGRMIDVVNQPVVLQSVVCNKTEVTIGESIQIHVVAENVCDGIVYTYEVYKGNPSGDNSHVDSIAGSDTITYTPETAGEYYFIVQVTQDNVEYEITDGSFSVLPAELPVIESITASGMHAYIDDTISWTAYAYGGTGFLQYAFELYRDGVLCETTEWSYIGNFYVAPNSVGNYGIICKVMDKNGSIAVQEGALIAVTEEFIVNSFVADSKDIVAGTPIRFTADVTGGRIPYDYQYDIYSGDTLVDTVVVENDSIFSYTLTDHGEYSVKLTVIDDVNNSILVSIEGISVSKALADFRLIEPIDGTIYDMIDSLDVECSMEITNADTYYFTLTDLTTGLEACSFKKSTTSYSLLKKHFIPGHTYSIYAMACDVNEKALAISETVTFSTDPNALGSTINILFPPDPGNESVIGDVSFVEIGMGMAYIVVEPVPNAKWYYVKYTPKDSGDATVTTSRTSEPYILVPTGLTEGKKYRITVYAGNDVTQVSASRSYFSFYSDEDCCKNLHFSSLGGTVNLSTSTRSSSWKATCDGDWVAVTPSSGTGSKTVTVMVQPNTTEKARYCYLDLERNSDGVEWYSITQSAYESADIKPLPAIMGWDSSDIGLFCEEVDNQIDKLSFSGTVTGGDGTLEYAKIVIADQTTGDEYTHYKGYPINNSINLGAASRLSMAKKYFDDNGNTFNAIVPGTFIVKILAKNSGNNEVCIASRNLYLSREITTYSITPDITDPAIAEIVTWTFDYDGGGDGMKFKFRLYLNGETYDETAYGSKTSYSAKVTDYGRYTVSVLVDYGSAIEVLSDDNSAVLLLNGNEAYTEPYISSTMVSTTTAEINDKVTWRIIARKGLQPYEYKYVIYRNGSQYEYVNYDEGAGASYTLTLTKVGEYTSKLYVRDAYGTVDMEEGDIVTVTEGATTPTTNPTTNPLYITYPEAGKTLPVDNLNVLWNNYAYDHAYYLVTLLDMTADEYVHTSEKKLLNSYTIPSKYFVNAHKYKITVGVYNASYSLIREASVICYTNGTAPHDPSPHTAETGFVPVSCPINGATYPYEDLVIKWGNFENAAENYLSLRDMTLYPGDGNTIADSYVYNDVVSGNSLVIAANRLEPEHTYRMWIEAKNAEGMRIASRTITFVIDKAVTGGGSSSSNVAIPTVTFNRDAETIKFGQAYSLDGVVNANGGTLDMVWVVVTDSATKEYCDYAICDAAYMRRNGSNLSSFDLGAIADIWTGEGSSIGTSGSGYATAGSTTLNMGEAGKTYVVKIRARNTGDDTLHLIATKTITVKAADFMYFLDPDGRDLNGTNREIVFDYKGNCVKGSKMLYMYTNESAYSAWTSDSALTVNRTINDVEQLSDGLRIEFRMVIDDNPFAADRTFEVRAYDVWRVTGKSSETKWVSFTVIQEGNPNVPIVASAAIVDGNKRYDSTNPIQLVVGDHNYENGYSLEVELSSGVDSGWAVYTSNPDIAQTYRSENGLVYIHAKSCGSTSLYISNTCADEFSNLPVEAQVYELCRITVITPYHAIVIADPTYCKNVEGNPIFYRITDSDSMIGVLRSMSFDNGTSINRVDPDIYTIKDIRGPITRSFLQNSCADLAKKTSNNSVTYVYILCHGDKNGTLHFGLDEKATVTLSALERMLYSINGKVILMLGSCRSGTAILEEGTNQFEQIARYIANAFKKYDVAVVQREGVFTKEPKYYVLAAAGADENGSSEIDVEYNDGIAYINEAGSFNRFTQGLRVAANYANKNGFTIEMAYQVAYRYCIAADSDQHVQVWPSDSNQIIFQKME